MNIIVSFKVNVDEGLREKIKNGTVRKIKIATHSTSKCNVEVWISEA